MGDLIVNEFFKMMIFGFRVIFNVLIPLLYNLILFISDLLAQGFRQQDPDVSATTVIQKLTFIWSGIGLGLMVIFLAAGAADARVVFLPIGLAVTGYIASTKLTQWWFSPANLRGDDPDTFGTDRKALEEEHPKTSGGEHDGVYIGQEVKHE